MSAYRIVSNSWQGVLRTTSLLRVRTAKLIINSCITEQVLPTNILLIAYCLIEHVYVIFTETNIFQLVDKYRNLFY